MNERITSLVSQTTAMTTRVNGIVGTLAVQKMQLNEIGTVATTARDIGCQNSSTLDTLEEGLCLLWARQPAAESEFEGEPHINQIFDPKTSIIAAFFTIYETAMQRATDDLKKEQSLPAAVTLTQPSTVTAFGAHSMNPNNGACCPGGGLFFPGEVIEKNLSRFSSGTCKNTPKGFLQIQ
ncbi:hypothetical protein DSO57_1039340 [Entomophthora muscae]|uniref:Uncharacterized protein n=1 Tax=Entomophthora muscae TaxID=34485 RepID=A0ACC2S0I5_9FUNG|nr:hypothetical protein DSO57_1039340 [Entomophthora muscae]